MTTVLVKEEGESLYCFLMKMEDRKKNLENVAGNALKNFVGSFKKKTVLIEGLFRHPTSTTDTDQLLPSCPAPSLCLPAGCSDPQRPRFTSNS